MTREKSYNKHNLDEKIKIVVQRGFSVSVIELLAFSFGYMNKGYRRITLLFAL